MKKSRIKYSKANIMFSQLVSNIYKQKKITYNNLQEKRLKHMIFLQAVTESENSIENVFIETEELYKFFSSTKINNQSDIAQQIYYSLKNRKYIEKNYEYKNQNILFRLYVFRIFAPINLMPTSLAVCVSCTETFDEGLDLNYLIFTDSNSSQDLVLHKKGIENLESGNIMINNDIVKNEYNKKIYEYFRVIMNLIFYMNAFPENVLKGVPSRAVIDEKSISDKKITISKNMELFKNLETSPHLRRGHWRTFTSTS